MFKKSLFLLLILCFSTSIHAQFEDNEARRAILDDRAQIKALVQRIDDQTSKLESKIRDLNTRLDLIEKENKNLKGENAKVGSDLDNKRPAVENPGYQELRDEINSINRLLLQIMSK